MKNIENMCVSPGDGRMTGDGSTSKSDGNFIVVKGRQRRKLSDVKGVIAPLAT